MNEELKQLLDKYGWGIIYDSHCDTYPVQLYAPMNKFKSMEECLDWIIREWEDK